MRIFSWNVNGIRAIYKKGFTEFLDEHQPDILCIQETKAHPDQLTNDQKEPAGYKSIFSSAEKKGYSGVAIYYRSDIKLKDLHEDPSSQTDILQKLFQDTKFKNEGRFNLSYIADKDFYLFNIYYPSGTSGAERQAYKYEFLDYVLSEINKLPSAVRDRLIIAGDYNICHREIDIHHPDRATKQELSGFLPEERAWFSNFLESGFTDTFRHCQGDVKDRYSWWSYRANARAKNLGWRIDYIATAEAMNSQLKSADILSDQQGSDHAPIMLELR